MRKQWWTMREQWTHVRLLFTGQKKKKKKKGKRGIENARISTIQTLTTSFYDSLNLTLFSPFLLPHLSRLSHSPFQSFCFHASLLNHIAQVISLSLFGNFLKLKLNYHIYMLNIIYVCVCVVVGSVTHRNAKFTTTHHTIRWRYLKLPPPPHHTPPVELCRVRFGSVQVGFVSCGRNLNKPNTDTPHAISTSTWCGNVNSHFAWLHCLV